MKTLFPPFRLRALAALALGLAAVGMARAQWVSESYSLKPGWNAIWVPLDCTHAQISDLGLPTGIEQLWRWNPLASTTQYVTTPTVPQAPDAEWAVWRRGDAAGSTLFKLTGNAAYLVKVSDTSPPISFSLVGKPLVPRFNGQVTGLSFTGFPMDPSASTIKRRFGRFFSFDSVLKLTPEVFAYVGGKLSAVAPKNPVQITQFSTDTVDRGVAYWVSAKQYTPYYGPVSIVAADDDALDFSTGGVARTFRVRNVTDPATNQTLTVTLKIAPSAAAPAGQAAVAGAVPLLSRGELDTTTLQYPYTPFTTTTTVSLAPGEEREFTFYLDRSAMATDTGKVYQSILQVTDSLGMTRIDLPVRAVSTNMAGLWVGELIATGVEQIQGVTSVSGSVPGAGFSQRAIVHIDAAGKATLLQEAYVATPQNGASPVVFTKKAYDNLSAQLNDPARVSSAFFPLELALAGSGTAGRTGTVTFNVPLDYQAPTNPFVHGYHPAHDNLSARFDAPLVAGVESYTVIRAIQLKFGIAGAGITDPAWGNTVLGGDYSETLTGLRAVPLNVSGSFILRRVSIAPNLVTQ